MICPIGFIPGKIDFGITKRKPINNIFDLIARSEETYGKNKFNFNSVVLPEKGAYESKIELICITHNQQFFQTIKSHISGNLGCSECQKHQASKSLKCTTEKFIEKSKKKWGLTKYFYTNTIYVGSHEYVIINCQKHNIDFKQKPNNHLSGFEGCKFCSTRKSIFETFELKIKRAY